MSPAPRMCWDRAFRPVSHMLRAPMDTRFDIRPDPAGFSVRDLATGETLVIAKVRQCGLSREDAEHTAAVLNQGPDAPSPTTH